MDGHRLGLRMHPPSQGQDTDALLAALGLGSEAIAQMRAAGAVA
jgi:crotonobetainyl-CoA:carnitine CoA-transferase CaiB-like acyl-CoA transferase